MMNVNQGKRALLTMLSAAAVLTAATATAAAQAWDVRGNWAEQSINTLMNRGIFGGYPDGAFKPNAGVTRAEFAKIVAKAMDIPQKGTYDFNDVARNHWANGYIGALTDKGILTGYPDGSFGPSRNVSRAEIVATLDRVAGVADKAETYSQSVIANFTDIPKNNWAFKYVETSRKLGILPAHYQPQFNPTRPATRAEAAYMVKALTDLKVTKGTVAWVDPYSKALSVNKDQGGQSWMKMDNLTTLFRNNVTTGADNLLAGDKVHVIARATGEPLFIKASGQVTKQDVLNKASAITGGVLSPYQVQALMTGDWNNIKTDLSASLLSRLMENGLQYNEASAIMGQDWKSLEGSAKTRLSQALSSELGIAPSLIDSLASQNWQQAGEMAKEQLGQALLQKLMNM